MAVIQFAPLQSRPSPSLWAALAALKLDKLKLDEGEIPISGRIEGCKLVQDRQGAGAEAQGVFVPGSVDVGGDAVDVQEGAAGSALVTSGVLKNFNTIEDFKKPEPKKELLDRMGEEILASFETDSPRFNPFLLLTHADLKKYKFNYWFAFPALVQKPAWEYAAGGPDDGALASWSGDADALLQARADAGLLGDAWLARGMGEGAELRAGSIPEWTTFFANVPEHRRTLVIIDSSSLPECPPWRLRNILFYLSRKHAVRRVRVIAIRQPTSASRVFEAILPEAAPAGESDAKPAVVGWERSLKGALASRLADLGATMDPSRLADQAVDLNLKLMRWRIMPSLDLDKIAETKCLLLGAGTLGCYVARCLMGWGVRNITFVDSARVSFSNPVRQPLFEFEDCLNGGKPKAQCAADSLKRIFPGVNAEGIDLSIPMPGHPISANDEAQVSASVDRLAALVESHDAVFLLMDSRESRWLPTVMCAARSKIVINAALGFDSWLVMRHGAGPTESSAVAGTSYKRLGCYYCNDIVAPADSLTDRTLDQMCTVTRPGIAPIAAASAVELLVSLIQHPAGISAPAETADAVSHQRTGGSALGLVPHQLRGFLGQWRTMLIEGAAYDRCSGCSQAVVDAYKTGGFPFLQRVFNESDFLEKLTGLDKLYEEGEAVLEAVDWDESDQEGSI